MAKMGMDDRIQLLGVELVDSLTSMGNLASARRPSAPHHAGAPVRSHTFSHRIGLGLLTVGNLIGRKD